MKRNSFLLVVMLAVALLVPTTANAQFGKLKGLGNKLKEKIKESTKNKGESIGNISESVSNGNVPGVATSTARSQAPWPMSSNPSYKGRDVRAFLYNIVDESDDYLTSLREEMYSRYKENAKIINNMGDGSSQARMENENLMRFYHEIQMIVRINVSNVPLNNGAIDTSDPHLLVTSRQGGGIGYWVMKKDGNYRFCVTSGDGAFLSNEDLATAKEAALRMRKFQTLTYAFHVMLQEAGEKCDPNFRVLYNYCGIYANAVEDACKANTPENIERKPRPATGAMHASMKAKALAVAKADDKDVVDVIITSAKWDVKMNGLIPVNRNIYGYYVVKDAQGLMCLPRMWVEDYIGNGKYGKLRAGGTGVTSPFYIK